MSIVNQIRAEVRKSVIQGLGARQKDRGLWGRENGTGAATIVFEIKMHVVIQIGSS